MNYQIIIDGEISRWGYSKNFIRDALAQHKGKHVDMKITSLGGDLDQGLDIRQQLIDHGDVTAFITGFTASAATIIAMGAKKVCMSKYAFFLVHKCSNIIDVWGQYNADEIQSLIEQLQANKAENDKIDLVIAQLYASRCKKTEAEMLDLLTRGGWLTAQEAQDWGFIDEIFEDDEEGGKTNLTPELRQKFNAYSLPLDGIERALPSPGSQSLLSKIYEKLCALCAGKPERSAEESSVSNNQTEKPMAQIAIYSAVMSALSVQTLDVNEDGSVTLAQDQLEAINDALRQNAADIAERDNTIADLTAKVDALKSAPAAETTGIVDDTAPAYMSSEDAYNLIKDL